MAADPISQQCEQCGHRQFNDRIGPQPRCSECSAFMSYASEEQCHIYYKRLEQSILHEEGYVTVGGWVEGVESGVRV